ncbi:MAG: L-histidine N(alpha)-methyltransferase [Ekhidna sp.]
MNKESVMLSPFATEVINGLTGTNKQLPSKYFYDAKGDELFQKIMHLDEYYLTRKELEIFESQKSSILESIYDGDPFRIIELGAGDGLKTKILLKYFIDQGVDFTYSPVDISGNVLEILSDGLKNDVPGLKIDPYEGDYFDALEAVSDRPEKDVVFFLGSNVGNFPQEEARGFLKKLRSFLGDDDLLFMGVDLKKDPDVILAAYNDSKGVTREFNLNLLDRINNELDADFDKAKFKHYPYYNPHTGECRSYLISTEAQDVHVAGEKIHFHAWESIFMEVSKKYDERQLQKLSGKTGFEPLTAFYDNQQWFADVLWKCD